ncbi:hypothetical protein BDN67DRAFT_61404 [Paxillus ammoniavirescens]|nr:hypothetical protein BDN67DRAFT_61404 [Paxillus ammoniavirescens]
MSASEIQSLLAAIQLNDYQSVVIATVVGYDFILTFSDEIEYVWKRPWSWVSMLFIVVRYVGCLGAMLGAFVGSSFVQGPIITYVSTRSLRNYDLILTEKVHGDLSNPKLGSRCVHWRQRL